MPTLSSAGTSASVFISQVRSDLRDPPQYARELITPNGADTVYKLAQVPIADGDPYLTVRLDGVVQAIVPNRAALVAGSVCIDYDLGFLFFATPPVPTTAGLVVEHSKVRWRDSVIQNALEAGLRDLFPDCGGQVQTYSFTTSTDVWEYPLSPTAFWDPRTRILSVEALFPGAAERYQLLPVWRRVGLTTMHLPDGGDMQPGMTIRVTYLGPYQSLGDLEGQLQELPITFAKWKLLMGSEVTRSRADQAAITQESGASPPGTQSTLAANYMQTYKELRARYAKVIPITRPRSTYGA